jgi:hypothetical protein
MAQPNLDVVDIDAKTTITDDYVVEIQNAEATDGRSYGVRIKAGSTSADQSFVIQDHDASNTLFKITGDGDVNVGIGDILFGTAGKGINLGVTSNTDANTLDDYEEGTFTPAADSFSGTMTFTTANYVKIGKLVHVNFKMTSDGNSDTDQVSISGFPFSAVAEHPVSLSYNTAGSAALHSANDPTIPNAMINTAEIMYVYVSTGGAFKYSSMGTGFIRVSGTYITT